MHKYVIMLGLGHNRVYYDASELMAEAELKLALNNCNIDYNNIKIEQIGGVDYITFFTSITLTATHLEILSRLSFLYAIFKVQDQNLLLPQEKIAFEYFDSKITSLLKYSGKTNEIFTKLMINVAVLTRGYKKNERLSLLDPVAGKGTTLYQGLVNGYNVCGIEIMSKFVKETNLFIKKFLTKEKIKHNSRTQKLYKDKHNNTANVTYYECARSKEEYTNSPLRIQIICGDTTISNKYLKKDSFDIIVGDLPYGIGHGSHTDNTQKSLTRNPTELLHKSLDSWHNLMKKDAVMVLAWNTYLVPRIKMLELLQSHNFVPKTGNIYDQFEHRVDNSILRDIIVATKKP